MRRARNACSLIASWLERDGIGLLECRMFLFPGVYRLTVEDQQGVQRARIRQGDRCGLGRRPSSFL